MDDPGPRAHWRNTPWAADDSSRPARGLWFAVVVTLLLQIPGVFITAHAGRHGGPAGILPVIAVALGFAASFALLGRRRYPGPVVALTGLLSAAAIAFGSGPPFAALPVAIAVVSGIARGARVWVWSTLAGLALVVPFVASVVTGSPLASIRPLVVALVLCFLVGLGEVFRNRRERYREMSRQIALRRRSEAEAERVRIARELHDVLAHSLSQISVQAGVGLHLFDQQPERARESLQAIKTTSGQALEEVRGVLGFLRGQGDDPARSPAPDLARLPALVQSFEAPALTVELRDELPDGVPPTTQQALYRIVQESLTNVSRHAGASRVTVELLLEQRPGRREYVVTVVDDGSGADPAALPGRGLTGMRERAELLGGTLVTSSPPGGGFRVEARIPAAPDRSEAA